MTLCLSGLLVRVTLGTPVGQGLARRTHGSLYSWLSSGSDSSSASSSKISNIDGSDSSSSSDSSPCVAGFVDGRDVVAVSGAPSPGAMCSILQS